jgi:hypothetical protein
VAAGLRIPLLAIVSITLLGVGRIITRVAVNPITLG